MTWHRQFVTSFGWNTAGIGVGQVLAFGFLAYAARHLDAYAFGLAAICLLVLELTRDLMQAGLPDCLVRDREWNEALARSAFGFQLLLAVGLAGLVVLAGGLVQAIIGSEVGLGLMVIALVYPLEAVGSVPLARLRHRSDYRGVALGQICGGVAALAVGVLALEQGAGFMALLYSRLAQSAATTLGNLVLARWRPVAWGGLAVLRPVVGTAGHIVATRMLSVLNVKATDMIIAVFGGTALLGAYQLASRLLGFVLQVILAPFQAVCLSQLSARADRSAVRPAVVAALRLVALVVFPVATGMAALAPDLVHLLFGPGWLELADPVAILLLAALPASLNYLVYPALVRVDQAHLATRFALTLLAIGVGLTLLAAGYGLVAVAGAFSLRTAIGSLVAARLLRSELGLTWRDLRNALTAPAVAVAAMLAVVLLVRPELGELLPIARAVILAAIGAATYTAVVGASYFVGHIRIGSAAALAAWRKLS
jgi:O-antigen/teichoic acid export membrane protein